MAEGSVHTARQAVEHAHTRYRGIAIEKDWYIMAGTPIKFSRSAEELRYLPPTSGQHTRELLDQFGFSSRKSRFC